jgi:hypothetical protein
VRKHHPKRSRHGNLNYDATSPSSVTVTFDAIRSKDNGMIATIVT